MPVSPKPSENVAWAESLGATVTEPASQRPLGFPFQYVLPAGVANWLQRATGRWLKWLEEKVDDFDSQLSSININVGTLQTNLLQAQEDIEQAEDDIDALELYAQLNRSNLKNHVHNGGSGLNEVAKVHIGNHVDYGINGRLRIETDNNSVHRLRHDSPTSANTEIRTGRVISATSAIAMAKINANATTARVFNMTVTRGVASQGDYKFVIPDFPFSTTFTRQLIAIATLAGAPSGLIASAEAQVASGIVSGRVLVRRASDGTYTDADVHVIVYDPSGFVA